MNTTQIILTGVVTLLLLFIAHLQLRSRWIPTLLRLKFDINQRDSKKLKNLHHKALSWETCAFPEVFKRTKLHSAFQLSRLGINDDTVDKIKMLSLEFPSGISIMTYASKSEDFESGRKSALLAISEMYNIRKELKKQGYKV